MTDTERTEKAIKKLNEIGKIVAFLKTDDEAYSAGEDLDKIQQDLIRFFSALLQQPQPSAGEFVKKCKDVLEGSIGSRTSVWVNSLRKKLAEACVLLTTQAQTIAEQGIRLDTVNRIGKEACEELDQLQNENTERAEEIRQMKEGLISVRKSTEIMEARRFADQALGKKGERYG